MHHMVRMASLDSATPLLTWKRCSLASWRWEGLDSMMLKATAMCSLCHCDSRHKVKLLLLSVNCKVGLTNIKPCVGQSKPTRASFVLRHAAALFPLHAGHAYMYLDIPEVLPKKFDAQQATSLFDLQLAVTLRRVKAWDVSFGRAAFQNRNTEAEN